MKLPTFVFYHQPKCGGSSMNEALMKIYGCQTIGPPQDYERQLGEGLIKPDHPLYSDHFSYGFHKTTLKDLINYKGKCITLTMLRSPLKRVMSDWLMAYDKPDSTNPNHHIIRVGGLTIDDMYTWFSRYMGMANIQTMRLSNLGHAEHYDPSFWKNRKLALKTAKKNMREINIVGTTERFNDTLKVVCKVLGAEVPTFENKNVAKREKPIPSELATQVAHLHNAEDTELWHYADELLTQQMKELGL